MTAGFMTAGERAGHRDRYSRPLLVGEDNPYGADPRYALYPYPKGSAGSRLCRLIMEMTLGEYLRRFDRVNLCEDRWNMAEARSTARILASRPYPAIVLFGRKVQSAFDYSKPPRPFYVIDVSRPYYVLLPHPSGRCRIWNEPGSFEKARAALREAGVL